MSDSAASVNITVDPAFVVGPVRRETFGTFVEHLGRCVYTGIYEPDHSSADEDGFRGDVLELTRELGISTVRYPGGNFVSGYRWEDGTGPVEERPRRLDLAWHSTDPNWVGVDEFVAWCVKADVQPMMAVNLGTRGVAEALDLLEYCNVAGGTTLSDHRRTNGSEDPHNIRIWCLGNEMDGPWQIGHKTASEYGRLAAETARAMRMIDKDLQLVACGSSSPAMATFGAWETEVLAETYDVVDMISAHQYWENHDDLDSFLAAGHGMNAFIADIVASADAVRAAKKATKKINISFDEWNIWHASRAESRPPKGDDWPVAPVLLEDLYTVADAVAFGGLLITLLKNTDRVHSASLAQLVNVIAPIMTEPGGRTWRQTTFHPFALTSRYAAGEVLRLVIDSPHHQTERYGEVAQLDAVATFDASTGATTIFAINRSQTEAAEVAVDMRGAHQATLTEAVTYSHSDLSWHATAEDADSVLPQPNESAVIDGGHLKITLPAASWSMIRVGGA